MVDFIIVALVLLGIAGVLFKGIKARFKSAVQNNHGCSGSCGSCSSCKH